MNKLFSTFCAAAVTLTAVAAAAPAVAAPMPKLNIENGNLSARSIQHRRGFYRDNNRNYFNGHRGYRDYRAGWRRHNGYWFPPAAFIAGAIIGGALAQPAPLHRPAPAYRPAGNAHVQWCHDRYQSYRAYDNTFQPYNGPRQQCYSPYS